MRDERLPLFVQLHLLDRLYSGCATTDKDVAINCLNLLWCETSLFFLRLWLLIDCVSWEAFMAIVVELLESIQKI